MYVRPRDLFELTFALPADSDPRNAGDFPQVVSDRSARCSRACYYSRDMCLRTKHLVGGSHPNSGLSMPFGTNDGESHRSVDGCDSERLFGCCVIADS